LLCTIKHYSHVEWILPGRLCQCYANAIVLIVYYYYIVYNIIFIMNQR